jgi:hypothetical protein
MNWQSQHNEEESASQLLELALPSAEPLSAKRTIYAVGSPESTVGASVRSTLLGARLPNPFLELGRKAVLSAVPSPFLQPSREQLSKQISGTKPPAARRASSHAAAYTAQIEFDFQLRT